MADIVAALRADFHGPQRALYRSPAKRKIGKTTRRSGKTSGGTHETLARCLEASGTRALYCNATKAEAKRLAWRSDTRRDGWIDLLRLHGLRVSHKRAELDAGKADCFVDETELTIDFANGSQLAVFCADDEAALAKLRGVAKHVIWVDEVQKFVALETFVDDVIGASMADFEGEIWLTGTPDVFCAGYFYEATKEPDQGERIPGWEVHEFSVLDNPFFGADRDARFARAIRPVIVTKKPRKFTGTDAEWVAFFMAKPPPWFVREWLGRWTLEGALFVYPVHEATAQHGSVTYAPQRLRFGEPVLAPEGHALATIDVAELGWLDLEAALADLPATYRTPRGKRRPITWLFALGADFGYSPDPFALVVLAFSPDVADVYEVWSWKQTEVHPDDQRDAIRTLSKALPNLVVFVGDAGGQQGAQLQGWRERLGMEIENADKAGKRTWIALLGGEITSARFHYREGSPLLHEHQHLLWLERLNRATGERKHVEHKTRVLPDKTCPGNHCSDAGLYAYRHLVYRRTHFPGAEPNHGLSTEAFATLKSAADEAAMEAWVDRATETISLRTEDPLTYAGDEHGY